MSNSAKENSNVSFDRLGVAEICRQARGNTKMFGGIKDGKSLRLPFNGNARFIRFSLQTCVSFHLDTIEVLSPSGINLEQGTNTIISSIVNGDIEMDGRNVVKKKLDGGVGFHSQREMSPWLTIDLAETCEISEIVVHNRHGEYYYRAFSLKVDVSNNLCTWSPLFDNWQFVKFCTKNLSAADVALVHACIYDEYPAREHLDGLKRDGRNRDAEKFYTSVNELLAGQNIALGPHGFVKTFGLMSDESKINLLNSICSILKSINTEFNLPAFVSSGTLLGLHRDGKLIDFDDDFDICYVSERSSEAGIVREREQLKAFLLSKGCRVSNSDCAHLKCRSSEGVEFDLFTGFFEDGKCSLNPLGRKRVEEIDVLPVVVKNINGVDVFMPNNPEVLLKLNYGENWKYPDPLWSFKWGEAHRDYKFLYFNDA